MCYIGCRADDKYQIEEIETLIFGKDYFLVFKPIMDKPIGFLPILFLPYIFFIKKRNCNYKSSLFVMAGYYL